MPSIWSSDFVLLFERPLFVVEMLYFQWTHVLHRYRWYPIRNCTLFWCHCPVQSWFVDVPIVELNKNDRKPIRTTNSLYCHIIDITHFDFLAHCFVVSDHRYLVDAIDFCVSWMLCIRRPSLVSALDWPIASLKVKRTKNECPRYVLSEVGDSNCRRRGRIRNESIHWISINFNHHILTTFSPCSDGTDSRSDVKLSFMWSLRFRSNALWCARFSAWKLPRRREFDWNENQRKEIMRQLLDLTDIVRCTVDKWPWIMFIRICRHCKISFTPMNMIPAKNIG